MKFQAKKLEIGQKIGRLTIIEAIQKNNSRGYCLWKCECECGKIVERTVTSLTKNVNKIPNCGNSIHNTRTNSPNWSGFEDISGTHWGKIKARAKQDNRELTVDLEYLWNLFLQQNKKCALTGLSLRFAKTLRELIDGLETASLDRIDSSKGYIINNVQWVHKDINNMKWDLDQEYFIQLANSIYRNQIKNEKK